MSIRVLSIAMIAALLGGCANSPDVQRQMLASSPICCEAYSKIPVTNALSGEHTVHIDDQSPVFEFSGGRSYFSAMLLPESANGKTLSIRTFAGGGRPGQCQRMGMFTFFQQ